MQIPLLRSRKSVCYFPIGYTTVDFAGRNTFGNHGASRDNRAVANFYPGKNYGSGADPDVPPYLGGSKCRAA
jgi:hypothetical protein